MVSQIEWLREIVSAEIAQKKEEGCDPAPIEAEFESKREAASAAELEALWHKLYNLPPGPSFRYEEPSDLDRIRAARQGDARPMKVDAERLEDQILGAWLGRCAGCLLGKPVEGWSKQRIEDYLRSEGAYPPINYLPRPREELGKGKAVGVFLGEIHGMPRDDDVDYTVLNLHILESYGVDVTSEEIGAEWLGHLQYGSVYTAERVAYRNLVNLLPIPETASYLNPYREWIGAQIRADAEGYVVPGMPVAAADLAFRDARISHVKNGVYGEMMASAMVAAAFSTSDPRKIIQAGLSVIPSRSRLSEAVRSLLAWSGRSDSWEECWKLVSKNYGHYSPVHTINNALNVVLALLYGGGDFTTTISIAVMAGWDTDCNGATAGSIIGAALGASGIPARWKDPLDDRVQSFVRGYHECRITDLAMRTKELALRQIQA